MSFSESFSPQVNATTEIIILGSMPGLKSLQASQYYAHPRNCFWSIMELIFSIERHQDYDKRLQQLNDQRIGLWDVYYRCFRPGSLDSAIVKDSAEINDFETLLSSYPSIKTILFNGKAAEKAFNHHYKQTLKKGFLTSVTTMALASTSPANAAISFDHKFIQWQAAIDDALRSNL